MFNPLSLYFSTKKFKSTFETFAPYGGFPIITSKPPFSKTFGNACCQLKAFSPAISGSSINELPHLILPFKSFNFRLGCAVRNQRESFAISTLSSFKSTPNKLFSKMLFSTSLKINVSPNNLACNSSMYLCSSIKKSKAWFKKAPLPQAGSQIVSCNNQLRYSCNLSIKPCNVFFWRFLSVV